MLFDPLSSLILASESPYKKELLERLHLSFTIVAPCIDESALARESARHTALRLSEQKAKKVGITAANAVIIASDQVVTLQGKRLRKPGNYRNALAQLKKMRGQEIHFYSALSVYDTNTHFMQTDSILTTAYCRQLPDSALAAYLQTEQPYDCVGSAKAEGLGIILFERIESSDPTALMGLPLICLTSMLLALAEYRNTYKE